MRLKIVYTMSIILVSGLATTMLQSPYSNSKLYNVDEVTTFIDSLRAGGGMSFDSTGNLHVSDYWGKGGVDNPSGNIIYKVTPDKEITIFTRQANCPTGNAIGPDGTLYVSNSKSNEIMQVNKNGNATIFAEEVAWPNAIVFDKSGNLYTPNYMNLDRTEPGQTLYRVSPDGEVEKFVQSDLLNGGVGLEIDEHENLYVANWNDRRIIKITPQREVSILAEIPGNSGEFIANLVYHDGNLYVAGTNTGRIFKVSLSGEVTTFAGTGKQGYKDGQITEAMFGFVNGLALHPNGNDLYVLEIADRKEQQARIRVISLDQSD